MKFFLTGATDEIVGHHLCKKLVSAGEDVTAITPSDALSSASLSNSRFKYLDVNPLEHEAIASVMAGHEVVVNILSDSKVLTPQNSQSILQGTRAALNAASRAASGQNIHRRYPSICRNGALPLCASGGRIACYLATIGHGGCCPPAGDCLRSW